MELPPHPRQAKGSLEGSQEPIISPFLTLYFSGTAPFRCHFETILTAWSSQGQLWLSSSWWPMATSPPALAVLF